MFGYIVTGVVRESAYHLAPVAVKELHLRSSSSVCADFAHEVLMNVYLHDHPNVPNCIGGCLEPESLFLVMQLMEGSLEDKLLTEGLYAELSARPLVLEMLLEACSAVHHLHQKRIIHRDIAARNFLTDRGRKVYISDFGLSLYLPEGKSCDHVAPFGAPAWMAPEALQNGEFSVQTDVYAFGMMLVEVFGRGYPFPDELSAEEVKQMVLAGRRPDLNPSWPDSLVSLIKDCWQQNPTKRPNNMMEVF